MSYAIAIVGAGIAGASAAYFAAPYARVLLLEAEDQPGYHTTGRSAAFFAESYGGPGVQPLTAASRDFLLAPPPGFTERALTRPRGALWIAHASRPDALAAIADGFAGTRAHIERTTGARHGLGALAAAYAGPALWEPGCLDIDVAELHRGFLAGARRAGAHLVTGARLTAITPRAGGFTLATRAGTFTAERVLNAAGAWADRVAALAGAHPLGIAPLRRTVAQVAVAPIPPDDLPLVIDAEGAFYFKPEGGRVWASPHDEAPDAPGDAQPGELDVATAIDRLETASVMRVTRLERAWAGLRSFAPDRLPVFGEDPVVRGLFWCAGQGGSGIQTAPAAGALCAARLLDRDAALEGVDPARYRPCRFHATETGQAR